jgi:uncharacterized protein (DUF305 family)
MPVLKRLPLIAVLSLAIASAAHAAELPPDAGRNLPPICTAGSMTMGGMAGSTSETMPMDEAHTALMAGMAAMQSNMSQAMLAKDPDVAFICGMIPHHQGAIDMARAELKYGKSPFGKKLAEGIIKAQEKEIAEMLGWLKNHGK